MLDQNWNSFSVIATSGALCRETLLILPLINFLYARSSFVLRTLTGALSVGTWLIMRWLVGFESYDVIGIGLRFNLENPFQTAAFALMSFNMLWVIFFLSL